MAFPKRSPVRHLPYHHEGESSAANDEDFCEYEVTMLADIAVQPHKSDYFHRNMHRMPHTHPVRFRLIMSKFCIPPGG